MSQSRQPPRRIATVMNRKLDADDYRDRGLPDQAAADALDTGPRPVSLPARGAHAVNWKIVRALGLALLVWSLIIAVLLSV
jgi:hypothetical protein